MRTVTRTRAQTDLKLGARSSAAKQQLDAQGVPLPPKPAGRLPGLPDDVTELDDSALMSLFSKLSAWTDHLGTQLAAAEVDERSADELVDQLRAQNAVNAKTEKTVTAAKAKAYEDPKFLEAKQEAQAAYAYRKLIESVFTATERKTALISRELTRRVGRGDRENRNSRWNA